MTTIQKPDGSYTESLEETMQVMLDHHIAVDTKGMTTNTIKVSENK